MKKQMIALGLGATLVSATASAAVDGGGKGSPMGMNAPENALVHQLDPIELETTRAGLGPLVLALGIASVDLALAGFFWGVYVPNYTTQDPSFDTQIH